MKSVVVIPARGGSKGIPCKNLLRIDGRPLIERAIRTAKRSKANAVIVSSDDERILFYAYTNQVRSRVRPGHLCTDTATSEDAVIDAVVHASGEWDAVILMQCTSPFTTPEDINAIIDLLEAGHDCAFTVVPSHPFLWDMMSQPLNFDATRPRRPRQKLVPQYRETGALYGMKWDGLRRLRCRFFGDAKHHVQQSPACDIDEVEDVRQALSIVQARQDRKSSEVPCYRCKGPTGDTIADEHGAWRWCEACRDWTEVVPELPAKGVGDV